MDLNELNRLYAGFLGLPADDMTPAAVGEAQFRELRATLEWARQKSPFYRERLSGLDISRVKGPADLGRIPFTSAEDLAQRPQDLLCLSQSQVERVITVRSSGSSGAAKRVFFTKAELEDTAAFFRCGLNDLLAPWESVLALLPYETPDGAGHLLTRALQSGGRQCTPVWPVGDMAELVELVREQRPGCLVGLPVHLLNLAERLGPGVVGCALFCSEYVPASLRRRVERALAAPSHIHYGSTESGLGGAVECGPYNGCHGRADIIWETVRPGGDRVCRAGEAGELVISTIRRRAMPLIRYRTGDLVRLSSEPCACGGLGPRLIWLGGRLNGPLLANGDVLSQAKLDEALFALAGLDDFQVYLLRGEQDELYTEYVAERGGPGLPSRIIRALLEIPSVARARKLGKLKLPCPQLVRELPVSHTIKRMIIDQIHSGEV